MTNPDRRTLLAGVAAGSMLAAWGSSATAAESPEGTYYVIAEIVSKPEKADTLRDLLVPFAALSEKEPGCLEYTLMEVHGEAGRFLTYERWTDKAALEVHMKTPDIQALVPKLGDVLAKPFTQIFLAKPGAIA